MLKVEVIAQIVHEALRIYSADVGQIKPLWSALTDQDRVRVCEAVSECMTNPKRSPREQHIIWQDSMTMRGYKLGDKIDHERKTHPCLTDFNSLPHHEKVKDYLFVKIVQALAHLYS